MDDKEQINHFSNDLWKLIDRYRQEYEVSTAGVIGTLQIAIHFILAEHHNSLSENGDPDDE